MSGAPRHGIAAALLALAALLLSPALSARPLRVGSKKFTESVVLGEVCCQLLRSADVACEHRREIGGTRVVYGALTRGDIDAYVEYSGTITQEILAGAAPGLTGTSDMERVRTLLAEQGIAVSAPLGFNNTYALALPAARAQSLGLAAITDLRQQPALRLRFSNEFMDRADGWPALRRAYQLPQTDVRGLDHDLAYRGLQAGDVDVIDVYTTDAEIAHYQLTVLRDDLSHFPRYEAVLLYRQASRAAQPAAFAELLAGLEGKLDAATMQSLNKQAKIERVPEAQVAAQWLQKTSGVDVLVAAPPGRAARLWSRTAEHLRLVAISLLAAVMLGIPLGILAAWRRRVGQLVLSVVGVVQTIPSLALLVFMIPLFGIGATPAIVALFLYSLLPIVRNTHQGLTAVPAPLAESAEALGLSKAAKLWRIDLPLASPAILAGIKTAAVINVGTATLGALIGAGGYGQPILTGIRLDDAGLIMEGAVPAAALALLVQGLFDGLERLVVPRGLLLGGSRRD